MPPGAWQPAHGAGLQRAIGNRAVIQALRAPAAAPAPVIQRLMTGDELVARIGIPVKKLSFFHKEPTTYEKLVHALDLYAIRSKTPTSTQDHKELVELLTTIRNHIDGWFNSPERKKVKKGDQAKREVLRALRYDVAAELRLHQEIVDGRRDVTNATPLGRGQVSSVYKTTFSDGFIGVFKEDETQLKHEDHISLLEDAGINPNDLRLSNRSIAMYKLDVLLGTGVIPRTERAYKDGKVGTVMEFVDGRQIADIHLDDKGEVIGQTVIGNLDFSQESIQRGLSNLQLLDAIAGQFDRHRGNVIVTRQGEIRGIDNDFSFGVKLNATKDFHHYRGLPSFIDERVAKRIMEPDFPAKVRKALTGLLTAEEIEQTLKRLEQARAYIASLLKDKKDRLVTKWDKRTYKEQLESRKDDYLKERESDVREALKHVGTTNGFTIKVANL